MNQEEVHQLLANEGFKDELYDVFNTFRGHGLHVTPSEVNITLKNDGKIKVLLNPNKGSFIDNSLKDDVVFDSTFIERENIVEIEFR